VQERLRSVLAAVGGAAKTSPTVQAELARLLAREARLLGDAEAERQRVDADEAALASLGPFPKGLLQHFDSPNRTDDWRASVYRLLFADVRLRGEGSGAGRRHELVRPYVHLLCARVREGTPRT
jgi:hypothetical protein